MFPLKPNHLFDSELENALGQYILYRNILEETEPERLIYLAIRKSTYQEIFSEPIGVLTSDPASTKGARECARRDYSKKQITPSSF